MLPAGRSHHQARPSTSQAQFPSAIALFASPAIVAPPPPPPPPPPPKKPHREKDIADVLRIVKKVSTSLPKQMKESMTKTNKKIAAMDNTLKGNEKEMKQKFAAMDKTLKVTRKQMNERFGAVYKTLERNSEEMNNNFGAVEKEVNEITAGSRRLEDKFNKVHTHGSRALVGYCSVGVVAFVYALHSSSWFRTLPPLRDDSSSSPPKRGR